MVTHDHSLLDQFDRTIDLEHLAASTGSEAAPEDMANGEVEGGVVSP